MKIKNELIQYYQWLRQYGINDSHSGNASIRDGNDIWITPTGACADTLTADELIQCSINQPPTKGASLDTALHLAVYNKNAVHGAILHSHGPYTVAMTMNGKEFIPFDFEGQFYFGKVQVINLDYKSVITESAQLVAEALNEAKAVVVCGHGIYVAAEDLNLAYKWTCSLELSAKTAFISKQAGTYPKP